MMSKIHKLKRPRIKSHADVIGLLADALDYARKEEILSIGISVTTKNGAWCPFVVTRKGTFSEAVGAAERTRFRIMEEWNRP